MDRWPAERDHTVVWEVLGRRGGVLVRPFFDIFNGRTKNIDVEYLAKEKHKDEADRTEEQNFAWGIKHGLTGFRIEVATSMQKL